MKKKAVLVNILSVVAVIALVIAMILLLADRTSAKSFSDIVPNSELFESCQIIGIDGEKMLTDHELDELVSQLEQLKYYKRGSYGNVMEGNVYTAFFASQQTDTVEVHISDAGKLYTDSTCYEVASGTAQNQITSCLEVLLDAE